MKRKAYMLKATGRRIKYEMPIKTPYHLADELVYEICSECFELIKETWDHRSNCQLFVDEPLAGWVKMGLDNE